MSGRCSWTTPRRVSSSTWIRTIRRSAGGSRSGLRAAMDILSGIDDIHFCELTSADVVRHRLVSDIVDAYARDDEARESG